MKDTHTVRSPKHRRETLGQEKYWRKITGKFVTNKMKIYAFTSEVLTELQENALGEVTLRGIIVKKLKNKRKKYY
jgi:hypothetical protein